MVFHLHSGIDIIEASLLHIAFQYITVHKIFASKNIRIKIPTQKYHISRKLFTQKYRMEIPVYYLGECIPWGFGNSLQRFTPNVPTFRQNVRANLKNFIQDPFWRVRFSNKNFKMVEDGLASLAIVKI